MAPLLALQAFNLRSPIERPTSSFSISRAIRRRGAGAPARSRHSSLRSHAENKIPPSAIPLGKTSGCRPSASYACKLSFLTRRTPASPRLKRLMRTDAFGCLATLGCSRRFYGENVSRFSEAAEQVHPRHGLRDTGDRRHDHHGHRPCRRSGGQAPQCREPTEPQPAGRGTSRKDQRRYPGRPTVSSTSASCPTQAGGTCPRSSSRRPTSPPRGSVAA